MEFARHARPDTRTITCPIRNLGRLGWSEVFVSVGDGGADGHGCGAVGGSDPRLCLTGLMGPVTAMSDARRADATRALRITPSALEALQLQISRHDPPRAIATDV